MDINNLKEEFNKPNSKVNGIVVDETVTKALSVKQDKEEGKGLSTNDFTSALKEKLEGLTNYNDEELSSKIGELKNSLDNILKDDNADASIIDTWEEVKDFLEGLNNSQNLDNLLNELKSDILALCANTYLPLSGGDITYNNSKGFRVKRNTATNAGLVVYANSTEDLGELGVGGSESVHPYQPTFVDNGGYSHKIFHDGNDGPGSGLDADTLDGKHASTFPYTLYLSTENLNNIGGFALCGQGTIVQATSDRNYPIKAAGSLICCVSSYGQNNQIYGTYISNRWFARAANGNTNDSKTPWREFAFLDSNVASADKLLKRQLTNENLNDIKDIGFAIYTYIGGNFIQNIPSNGYGGTLQVSFRDENNGIQKLYFFDDGASKSYIRKCVNGNWLAWKKMLTEDDLTDIKNRLTALENK